MQNIYWCWWPCLLCAGMDGWCIILSSWETPHQHNDHQCHRVTLVPHNLASPVVCIFINRWLLYFCTFFIFPEHMDRYGTGSYLLCKLWNWFIRSANSFRCFHWAWRSLKVGRVSIVGKNMILKYSYVLIFRLIWGSLTSPDVLWIISLEIF